MSERVSPSAVPNIPVTQYTPAKSIKTSTPDIIEFNSNNVPIDVMTEILFESIGGQEILSLSRNDIVNGQTVLYSPIKNLAALNSRYNPKNLFVVPATSQSYFYSFAIKLEDRVPDIEDLPSSTTNVVYCDPETKNIVVYVTSMLPGENVEIQVLSDGLPAGDIIYNIQEES